MFDKINEYYRSYYCIVVYLYVSNTVFEVLDVFVVLFDMFDVVFVVLFGVFDAVFAYRCNHSWTMGSCYLQRIKKKYLKSLIILNAFKKSINRRDEENIVKFCH